MRRQLAPLTPLALFIAVLGLAFFPSLARAHRLVVECRLVKVGTVQVEGWYSSPNNPHPAAQASVRVTRLDGSTLAEGELDARGFFFFTFERPEVLKVVVTHPSHHEEVVLPVSFLQPTDAGTDPSPADAPPPVISSRAEPWRESVKEILIGVGFLLALAAFVMSVRNARALREMKKER